MNCDVEFSRGVAIGDLLRARIENLEAINATSWRFGIGLNDGRRVFVRLAGSSLRFALASVQPVLVTIDLDAQGDVGGRITEIIGKLRATADLGNAAGHTGS